MQEVIIIATIFIAMLAFGLLTGCAIAPLIEEIKRDRIKRASRRYADRYSNDRA